MSKKKFLGILISEHAIERYRERVGPLPRGIHDARIALFEKLKEVPEKHMDLVKIAEKRTTFLPTPECFFIASFGSIVTVLARTPRSHDGGR